MHLKHLSWQKSLFYKSEHGQGESCGEAARSNGPSGRYSPKTVSTFMQKPSLHAYKDQVTQSDVIREKYK